MNDAEARSIAASADALGVEEETFRRCLSHQPELTLAHAIAYVDVDCDDFDAGRRGEEMVPSDVFYTSPVRELDKDREGTQKHNRLRQEANTRRPPFRARPAGNRRLRVSPYQLLVVAPAKSLRSPSSGASALPRAASSRRRARTTAHTMDTTTFRAGNSLQTTDTSAGGVAA